MFSQHLWIFKADEKHSSNSRIMVVKHTGKILTVSLNVDDLFYSLLFSLDFKLLKVRDTLLYS